jgi:hypothetical protein
VLIALNNPITVTLHKHLDCAENVFTQQWRKRKTKFVEISNNRQPRGCRQGKRLSKKRLNEELVKYKGREQATGRRKVMALTKKTNGVERDRI